MQTGTEVKPYRSGPIRFLALFLLAMVVFGNQYAFNNPQALEESMEEDLDIGETKFQLFYTIFAFPNIFATFIIGFLIDFLGVRTGIIALSGGVAIFQLMIALGGYSYSYTIILIGRMLFGLASESLITAQASMVSFWFKGKELAFALGIAVTFPQLGNALNSYLSPLIYEETSSLGAPLMVSVGICMMSFFCALGVAYMDKVADNADAARHIRVLESPQATEADTQKINLNDVKELKGSFWLLVVLCMFAVSLYVPFLDNANRMYQKRFCFTQVTAGKALMVTYIVAATFSAPLGLIVDKVGYKRYFIIGSMCIFTIAQAFILFYQQCTGEQLNGSIWGLGLIGIGYCFYGNCILPAIPLVVKKKVTGTAFGLMQMVESIALAFFPLITGTLVQKASTPEIGYKHSSLFFVAIGAAGICTSVGLLFVSKSAKKKLDRVSREKDIVENIKDLQAASQSDITSDQDSHDGQNSQSRFRSSDQLNHALLTEQEKRQVRMDL